MVRIVGGQARGRRLQVPKGQGVRPTTEKVREALFNVLRHRFHGPVDGARVLDLFAGAGTLGLEALSRGAAEVTFVEADRRHGRLLAENIATVGRGARGVAHIRQRRVEAFLAGTPTPHDLVFLDPPYAAGRVQPTLERLATGGWIAPDALICVEHPPETVVEPPPGFEVVFTRTWGMCTITLLTSAPAAELD